LKMADSCFTLDCFSPISSSSSSSESEFSLIAFPKIRNPSLTMIRMTIFIQQNSMILALSLVQLTFNKSTILMLSLFPLNKYLWMTLG
jgi:hypothetical protein